MRDLNVYDEDDLLPLSGLQHLAFCERQRVLIHTEGLSAKSRAAAATLVYDRDGRLIGAFGGVGTRRPRWSWMHGKELKSDDLQRACPE